VQGCKFGGASKYNAQKGFLWLLVINCQLFCDQFFYGRLCRNLWPV